MGDLFPTRPGIGRGIDGDALGQPDGASNRSSSIQSQLSSNRSSIPPSNSGNDREWETSPMYLALSGRLARTESTLSSLSSQVTQLTFLVKAALPRAQLPTGAITSPPASIAAQPQPQSFAPFDDLPQQSFRAPSIQTALTEPMDVNQPSLSPISDKSISALTQQISALSTSVAQLQKLQQSQGHSSRENSFSRLPAETKDYGSIAKPPTDPRSLISGPFTTPIGRVFSPPVNLAPQGGSNVVNHGGLGQSAARPFSPPVRPPGGARSFSTRGPGEGDKWSHPTFAVNSLSSDWLPGPGGLGNGTGNGMTYSTSGNGVPPGQNGTDGFLQSSNGLLHPSGQLPGNVQSGVSGMMVTKWDQLGLKPDLVRSIARYG